MNVFDIYKKNILDKKLITERFRKSLKTYEKTASIQHKMSDTLIKEIAEFVDTTKISSVFEIGVGTGSLTRKLLSKFQINKMILNDIVSDCKTILPELKEKYPNTQFSFIDEDIETFTRISSHDLIVSNATFQWLNDLPILLSKLRGYLKNDSTLAFTTFGPKNLKEMAEITRSALKYNSLENIQNILNPLFSEIICFEDIDTLFFESPIQLLKHLKHTGVTGIHSRQWTKSKLARFDKEYRKYHETKDGVKLTYNPMYFICKI